MSRKINQRQWDDLFAWFISNTEQARRNRLTALGAVLLSAGEDAGDVSTHLLGNLKFGRCGESAESELNKAVPDAQATSALSAPPLSNEQRPIKYDGNLLPSMTAMVTGFVDKLAKFYSPCPQGKDCAGDQKHNRIFACDHCSFIGCCACLDLHEAGGHESDSSTMRERIGYEY